MWTDDSESITAEIIDVYSGNIFGVSDSIKTIQITAPGYNCDGDTLRLSKNFGLIDAFNFIAFPGLNESYYDVPLQLYHLYGIESQNLGGSNLTTFDIFDFQPGDEIQYERKNLSYGEGSIVQIAEKYTSREDYLPDSIVYELDKSVLRLAHSQDGDSVVSNETFSTSKTIVSDLKLDALPTLPVDVSNFGEPTTYAYSSMSEGDFLQKQDLSSIGGGGKSIIENPDNGCYDLAIDGSCLSGEPYTFYKGLGGFYYNCTQGPADLSSIELTYFMKDFVEWGERFGFTLLVPKINPETKFEIFPNPASDKVTIRSAEASESGMLTLLDVSGREILRQEITSEESQLDISQLQSGIYFVRVTVSGNVRTQKLVVK